MSKYMEHYKLLLPEHINNNGVLFGGNLLKWLDEFAYITATLHYPGNRFVTIGLDNVVFKEPIKAACILCFKATELKLGNSSIQYLIDVYYADEDEGSRKVLFETKITFVNISLGGDKKEIVR